MRLAMSTPSKSIICSREDDYELRRGPWSVEEDDLLISYIANNGEGRWNLLAIRSGNPRKTKKENKIFLLLIQYLLFYIFQNIFLCQFWLFALIFVMAKLSQGLRRTGKSCRLRWLNYLKPNVKRGNLTSEEQLLIFELHSKWGNRCISHNYLSLWNYAYSTAFDSWERSKTDHCQYASHF